MRENEQQNLNFRQGEVNKALNLHEGELINHATNTFIAQQNEVDKELILKGLPFDTNDDWQQCKLCIIDWLNKKSAESKLAVLRKNKGGSKVKSIRSEARPYKGDVRDSYKQIKNRTLALLATDL